MKKNGGTVLIFEKKRKPCTQNLTKEWKQPPVVICNNQVFPCYSVLVVKNRQKIRSRCLVHEFPSQKCFNDINHGYRGAILKKNSWWLLPFYMAVATYCCYEECAERCALQLYCTSLNETY